MARTHVVLGHDRVKLVHGRIPRNRDLFAELVYDVCVFLRLVFHHGAETFDVIFLAFKLLILLLDHVLQGFDCLVGSVGNFLLLLLSDLQVFQTMVFDNTLQLLVLAQVIITFLPHSKAANLRFFVLHARLQFSQFLRKSLNLAILLLDHGFRCPVRTTRTTFQSLSLDVSHAPIGILCTHPFGSSL